MAKLFQVSYSQQLLNIWLFVLRICVAGFMLTHGIPKLMKFFEGGTIQFADPFGLGVIASLALAVFAEVVCSILIGIGLATRLATIPLIIIMSVAAFIAHANDPFGVKEKALLFLLIYVTILIAGPGKYSIDNMLGGKSRRKR